MRCAGTEIVAIRLVGCAVCYRYTSFAAVDGEVLPQRLSVNTTVRHTLDNYRNTFVDCKSYHWVG